MTDVDGHVDEQLELLRRIEQHQRIARSDIRWIMAMCLLWTVLGILTIIAAIFVIREIRLEDERRDDALAELYAPAGAGDELAGLPAAVADEDLVDCTEIYGGVRVVTEADTETWCRGRDGGPYLIMHTWWDCPDARLYSNDYAWGKLGEPAHPYPDGGGQPPAEALTDC